METHEWKQYLAFEASPEFELIPAQAGILDPLPPDASVLVQVNPPSNLNLNPIDIKLVSGWRFRIGRRRIYLAMGADSVSGDRMPEEVGHLFQMIIQGGLVRTAGLNPNIDFRRLLIWQSDLEYEPGEELAAELAEAGPNDSFLIDTRTGGYSIAPLELETGGWRIRLGDKFLYLTQDMTLPPETILTLHEQAQEAGYYRPVQAT